MRIAWGAAFFAVIVGILGGIFAIIRGEWAFNLCSRIKMMQLTTHRAGHAFGKARFAFWIQAAMSSVLFRSMTRIEGCDAVIRVYDEAGNVIETHEHKGDFKES